LNKNNFNKQLNRVLVTEYHFRRVCNSQRWVRKSLFS